MHHGQLDQWLTERGAELGAAQLHGSLCAVLSVRGPELGLDWLNLVFDADLQADLGAAERDLLDQFSADSLSALEAGELGFVPVLPDEDLGLERRLIALRDWCDGYVGGLGLAGLDDPAAAALSDTAREGLEDLARIARTELTLDDDAEADANAWEEVLEYVRVSVVLLFEELQGLRVQREVRVEGGHGRHLPH